MIWRSFCSISAFAFARSSRDPIAMTLRGTLGGWVRDDCALPMTSSELVRLHVPQFLPEDAFFAIRHRGCRPNFRY